MEQSTGTAFPLIPRNNQPTKDHPMKKAFIPFLLLTLTLMARAHAPDLKKEDGVEHPALHRLDARYGKESAVILLDTRRVEYVDNPDNTTLSAYHTLHKIIHINDDKGIEYYNKVYLGISDSNSIIDMRARSILPSGKIITIDKKNIKFLEEENGNRYSIFAMEGLEKGCEVEYTYTIKLSANYFGRENLQATYPTLEAQFSILGPPRLIFQMKGYNCAPEVSDTTLEGKRAFSTRLKDIPGAETDVYASYDANLQRIEYRLS